MKDINIRLKTIRGNKTQSRFSTEIGIPLTTLGRYERGENFPDIEFIYNIAKKFNISLEWLISGIGPMRADGTISETQIIPEQPTIPAKTANQCPRCERVEAKLEKVELQRDELAQENRQLWKENGELRERCATLEERQKQCCPAEYHPKKANIPSSDPLHIR